MHICNVYFKNRCVQGMMDKTYNLDLMNILVDYFYATPIMDCSMKQNAVLQQIATICATCCNRRNTVGKRCRSWRASESKGADLLQYKVEWILFFLFFGTDFTDDTDYYHNFTTVSYRSVNPTYLQYQRSKFIALNLFVFCLPGTNQTYPGCL